jgi:hypothetical protein
VPDARARIDPGRELRGKEKWKVEDLVCPRRELASTRGSRTAVACREKSSSYTSNWLRYWEDSVGRQRA